MPSGKGSYGKQVGRPKKSQKQQAAIAIMKKKKNKLKIKKV